MANLGTTVLRPLILRLAHHPWFRRLATRTRPGRAVASRFVAGESLDEAMETARSLDRARITSMLDHLGENVRAPEQAAEAAGHYLRALERIAETSTLDCAVSVKLTQLGLDLSRELCASHLRRIMQAAEAAHTLVMIDMESHGYVDPTLEVFRDVHADYPRIGVCLQSYLRRTERDVFALPSGTRIRLVKGSYLEEPDVVFETKREVDESYSRLFATLWSRGHAIDVATHDPKLIDGVTKVVAKEPNGWSRAEFQMLYGIRRDLQNRLAREGYPVRVYIPYGTEWYPYLTRRLAERPANMWFFLSNLLRRAR
ncbi:MAG TPA: proline dehydrogenase family protein [Actinomycetota bacterium]